MTARTLQQESSADELDKLKQNKKINGTGSHGINVKREKTETSTENLSQAGVNVVKVR